MKFSVDMNGMRVEDDMMKKYKESPFIYFRKTGS